MTTKQNPNPNFSAVQYMGLLMRQQKLNIDNTLSLVELINNSYLSAKDVITIMEEIFRNEKSGKILLATQILEYCVKNCNSNFHQAANRESFQKAVLGLLKRRGKMSLIKELSSNTENWSRIESRILYLIQLWYDAFILQESKYPNIINVYKILRKENVVFPPRNVNQRSLMAIETQSPIFDNIETIAESDKEKFKKRLKAMGLNKLSDRFQEKDRMMKSAITTGQQQGGSRKEINIDEISEKIAIIQSQDYNPKEALKVVEQVKRAIEYGKVKPNEQRYWKEVKQAAEQLIQEWQEKNAKLIQDRQQEYLEMKMHGRLQQKSVSQGQAQSPTKNQKKSQIIVDLLDIGSEERDMEKKEEEGRKQQIMDQFDEWSDFSGQPQEKEKQPAEKGKQGQEMNLLDL